MASCIVLVRNDKSYVCVWPIYHDISGPGIFNIKQNNGTTYSIRHAFDGLPVVHRVVIKGDTQQVTYNSRCTANSLRENIKAGSRIGLVLFGHLPDLSFFSWIRSFLSRVDNYIIRPTPRNRSKPDGLSVAVTPTPNFPLPVRWNKDNTLSEKVLVAKTDANLLQKIHAETLGKFKWGGKRKSLWLIISYAKNSTRAYL